MSRPGRGHGEPIGFYQATVRPAGCLIAYVLGAEHWRKGYAMEAGDAIIAHLFALHGVASVTAEIDARNAASVALAKRLGFSFAHHDAAERDDVYEITRTAWDLRRTDR